MTQIATPRTAHTAQRQPKVMHNPFMRSPCDPATLPRISVVTACLNQAETLEATLLSVLDQGYPNLEYVVLDGGSTDGSATIIAKYAEYLTYWRSELDGGQYEAIQEGFARTTGDVMGWLNGDDLLHRNALWTVADIFRQFPHVEWLTGVPTQYDRYGRVSVPGPAERWSRYRYLRGDYKWIQQESVMWRRSLWKRAGGRLNTAYRLAADMELWMRFFRHAKLYASTALIGGFRMVPGQRSETHRAAYLREADRIVSTEPLSDADHVGLSRIRTFQRFWLNIPFLGRSLRMRGAYEKLFQYPPRIVHCPRSGTFEICEENGS